MDSKDTIEFNQPDPAGSAGGGPAGAIGGDPAGAIGGDPAGAIGGDPAGAIGGDPAAGASGGLASGRARWRGAKWPGRANWSGRTRRVVTTVAASAVLLGGGAGIGMALTGGASASTANSQNIGSGTGTNTTTATSTTAAGRCARLMQALRDNDHPRAANGVQAFCRHRLLRLALVGGEHGEVTFQTKAGPKTFAFERGTIQAVSSSAITVVAKDGTTWSWDLSSSTKLRQAGHQVTTANLSTGEQVLVAGPVVNGINDAKLIRVRDTSGS